MENSARTELTNDSLYTGMFEARPTMRYTENRRSNIYVMKTYLISGKKISLTLCCFAPEQNKYNTKKAITSEKKYNEIIDY